MGAADEVPPHHDLLGERLPAQQQQPRRRAARPPASTARSRGRAATPASSGTPSTSGAPSIAHRGVLEVGSAAGPAADRAAPPARPRRAGVYAVAGETAPPSSPISTVARRRRASNRGQVGVVLEARTGPPVRVGQRDPQLQRRAATGAASGRRTARRARCRAPAVIRLSWPGRISWSEPTLSVCRTSPSTSQVTVCSPVCGCGGTRIPPVPRRLRAEVVHEAPGADHPPVPGRQASG